jgi:hypothetical protein
LTAAHPYWYRPRRHAAVVQASATPLAIRRIDHTVVLMATPPSRPSYRISQAAVSAKSPLLSAMPPPYQLSHAAAVSAKPTPPYRPNRRRRIGQTVAAAHPYWPRRFISCTVAAVSAKPPPQLTRLGSATTSFVSATPSPRPIARPLSTGTVQQPA